MVTGLGLSRRALPGLALVMLAGTATAQPTFPYPSVPRPRAETPGDSPGPGMVWQPGYWLPGGQEGYSWVPGRWVAKPAKFSRFVPGRWAWGASSWVWLHPHWE